MKLFDIQCSRAVKKGLEKLRNETIVQLMGPKEEKGRCMKFRTNFDAF